MTGIVSFSRLPKTFLIDVFKIVKEDPQALKSSACVCRWWNECVKESINTPLPISRRKVVIFTVPFQGHFDVLYRAAKIWQKTWNVEMVVCGWSNLGFPKCDGTVPYHYLQGTSPLKESCPTKFNLERALELREEVLRFCLEELKNAIDYIVYDFFALEGFLAARQLRIPHACSIPAVPGSFDRRSPFFTQRLSECEHLLSRLNEEWLGLTGPQCKSTLDGQEIQMISDGFLVQGQEQMLWGIREISKDGSEWLEDPIWLYWKSDIYHSEDSDRSSIYICFGTVVTGNLWDCNEAVAPFVIDILKRICHKLTDEKREIREIVISVPHRMELVKEAVNIDSPKIRWVEYADQPAELRRAQLFVNHGGGNGVREALLAGTPMMVIPFFGDQHVSADCVARHKAGLAHLHDTPGLALNTHQKSFYRESLKSLESNLEQLLSQRETFRETIQQLVKRSLDSATPIEQGLSKLRRVYWKEGDLLFGTNVDRRAASRLFSQGEKNPFRIGDMRPFSHYGEPRMNHLPRLIDQYHDALCHSDPNILSEELRAAGKTHYGKTLKAYQEYLKNQGLLPVKNRTKEHLWDCCIAGIQFFLKRGVSIHFAIGKFDVQINDATRMELEAIRKLYDSSPAFRKQLIFYRLNPSLFRVDPEQEKWFGLDSLVPFERSQQITRVVEKTLEDANQAHPRYSTLIQGFLTRGNSRVWMQSRVKKADSAKEKLCERGYRTLDDALGFRIIDVWTKNLYYLAEMFAKEPELKIYRRKVTERGKVLYLFGKTENDLRFEIQFWSSVIYSCFESEHDTIYKPPSKGALTAGQLEASQKLREEEHRLQSILDRSVLVDISREATGKVGIP